MSGNVRGLFDTGADSDDEGKRQELQRDKSQKQNAGTSGAFELFGLFTG